MNRLLMAALLLLPATAAADETVLVPAGATWSYLDDGVGPTTDWTSPSFVDSSWSSGPAQLGYGDGDEATTVSYGSDAAAKHITTWFRHSFSASAVGDLTGLSLELLRDDGAVVYLNGTELLRSNLPDGAIDSSTTATTAVGGADESTWHDTALDPGLLLEGDNVLAVEVHQVGGTSSDISLDLRLVGISGDAALTRGPYLQLATTDGITVRWRTDVATDSVVWTGSTPGSLSETASDTTETTEHEVVLTGLGADSTVCYAIGSSTAVLAGDDTDHCFTTAPAASGSTAARVWVLGDSGTADANAAAVADAYAIWAGGTTPDVWLMLGDNAYNTGTDDEYQDAVFDMYPWELQQTALWSVLGNHDGASADSATGTGPYYDIFTLPTAGEAGGQPSGTEAYYAFDHGDIHFVALDSYESDRAAGGAMLTWLEEDLAATDALWIVAFWHHPAYTKGSHDSDSELRLIEMRENVLPILDAYGVDLVLAGHSHSYERSYLLDGHYDDSSTLTGTMVLDAGDGDPAGDGAYTKPTAGMGSHEGAVYITAGSSGKISGGSLDHPAMVVSLNSLGSVVLDFDADTLQASFIDDTGTEQDLFSIVKGEGECTWTEPAGCGNGICEPDLGEDCVSCEADCAGRQSGRPSSRWCCGDGDGVGPLDCSDAACSSGSWECTTGSGAETCCGDGLCEGSEDFDSCSLDCEDTPTCSASGESCSSASECCSESCRGRRGVKTCR